MNGPATSDQRWVALLRGINVGGHRVKGGELVAAFVELGYTNVATYLASGNVVFDVGTDDVTERVPTEAEIAASLRERLGYEVPTLLRSATDFRAVAGERPFSDAEIAAGGKAQVIFVATPLTKTASASIAELATDADLLRVKAGAGHVHWLPETGISTSDLDLKELSRLAGVTTVRTANTVQRLTAKLLA